MPLQLLVLALDAALYPTLLAAVVVLLSQPRRRPLLTAYLAGGLTISIGLGLGIVAALKDSKAVDSSHSGLSWVMDLAVGGLAMLLAVALATRADVRFRERRRSTRPAKPVDADEEKKEPLSQRVLARGSVPTVLIAALALNLPGAAYLVALKDIAAAHHPTSVDIALVVGFNLIMFLLAEIPLLGLIFAPEQTVARVKRVNAWFLANSRTIAVVLSAVLGAFLITRGIVNS
ncbi:MAG TPA: GAP family protein [Thermoleophilaceae bacterium]